MGAIAGTPKENKQIHDDSHIFEGTCKTLDEPSLTPEQYAESVREWYMKYKGCMNCDFRINKNLTAEGYNEKYISLVIEILNNNQP